MSTLLDEPRTISPQSASQRLRATMAAVRIAFTWFGVRKSLNTEQKAQAADTFGAEGSYLSAGKKLIDTSHSAFKAVTSVRSSIQQCWRAMTVPYPEPGIRLIRRDVNDGRKVQRLAVEKCGAGVGEGLSLNQGLGAFQLESFLLRRRKDCDGCNGD